MERAFLAIQKGCRRAEWSFPCRAPATVLGRLGGLSGPVGGRPPAAGLMRPGRSAGTRPSPPMNITGEISRRMLTTTPSPTMSASPSVAAPATSPAQTPSPAPVASPSPTELDSDTAGANGPYTPPPSPWPVGAHCTHDPSLTFAGPYGGVRCVNGVWTGAGSGHRSAGVHPPRQDRSPARSVCLGGPPVAGTGRAGAGSWADAAGPGATCSVDDSTGPPCWCRRGGDGAR